MKRKTYAVATAALFLISGASIASQPEMKAGTSYRTTKTVQRNADGSVTITRFGTRLGVDGIYRDSATVQEAMALFAEGHPGVPIQVWVTRSGDGTAAVTAMTYDVQHVDSPSGPPPGTPGEPPANTPRNVSSVTYHIVQNGYVRNTTYARTVTPDPDDPGNFFDGDWYISSDVLNEGSGSGGGGCPHDGMGCDPSEQGLGNPTG